jgi:thiol-disulfide isomerase/thioredoxin
MNSLSIKVLATAVLLLFSLASFAQKAPEFSLPGDNGTINLADYRGKVVYLDFWASWCGPCRKSFPWMNELKAHFSGEKFEIIAINLDENREYSQKFIADTQPGFTIAYDSEGKSAESYKVMGMPSSYLIDKNGNIVSQHVGFRQKDKAKIEAEIASLLKQ